MLIVINFWDYNVREVRVELTSYDRITIDLQSIN